MTRPTLLLIAAFTLLPAAAAACPGETLLSCDTGRGRVLEVCADDTAFHYSFGPAGRPDLTLTAPLADGPVTPWPGIGSAIWSTVTFRNDGHYYEVWVSQEKGPDAPPATAGVEVRRDSQVLASLECRPGGTIPPAFTFEDRMQAAGLCWNLDQSRWDAC